MGDPELQELFGRSVGSFGDRVHAISDDQWTAATPCSEWDVRALVGHLVTEVAWVGPLVGGKSVADVGDELSGELTGDDPKASWDRYSGEAAAAVAEDGAMERTVRLTSRELSAGDYTFEVFIDLLIHGWDLARAIGAPEVLDPESVDVVYEKVKPNEQALKASGVFGPEVTVPPDADAQTRLLAIFGRVA
jgi:uncharacterized protein (TIGR03086 family)